MIGIIISTLFSAAAEAEARQEWLNSLPVDEANKIRAEDKRLARQKDLHRRKLEIAEAGRPRNFWGK